MGGRARVARWDVPTATFLATCAHYISANVLLALGCIRRWCIGFFSPTLQDSGNSGRTDREAGDGYEKEGGGGDSLGGFLILPPSSDDEEENPLFHWKIFFLFSHIKRRRKDLHFKAMSIFIFWQHLTKIFNFKTS